MVTRSYYSLRYGTLSVEDLVAKAKGLGLPTLVLTDINTSAGVFPFVKACREQGVQPVAGLEFRRDNQWLYTGIARNLAGFRELNEYLSYYNLKEQPLPDSVPPGTFAHAFVVYPFGSRKVGELGENEYLGVGVADVNRLLFSDLRKRPEKLLAFQPGSYLDDEGLLLHRHLRAIDNNILLSQLQPAHGIGEGERLLSVDALRERYALVPQVWQNTERLLAGCDFQFDFKSRKNLKHFTGTPYYDKLLLEKLAFDGLGKRYGPAHKEARKRVAHELAIIEKLGFSAYFLIAWDVTRYSTSRGFYHVGRGSGANSVVAYCLRITDVDPIELDLYFERFLNPKRTSPPDFDIDYSWDERDEVLDYIFKRYGTKRTALMGAMSTFQQNAVVRELGKVYGLPKSEIDALVERPQDKLLQSDITRQITRFGLLLQDFPNVRSIHAGGVLLSEEPLCTYTALDLPPKGMPTSQWDMYTAEEIGFEKLDILSQRGIGHIKECVQLVHRNRGLKVDAHEVEKFKQDPQVKKQLASGDTIGCFYIESPAMRGLLKKLRCDNYLSLVAASSIIRPGVAKSGMMREYINRFHHPDQILHLHPVMGEQLQETYGVMVYQEDVLKVCHHFAGLDLADADVLRRGMSGKFRSRGEFQKLVDKFISNCRARGYPEQVTQEVWRQVESFAGYSFSKAHSASFAVESYQSLFLKAHYPLEFMVAVINNFGGFYRAWVYVNEARKAGGTIHLPCINHGQALTCLTGTDVYLGFGHVQSVEGKVVQTLVREREEHGPYACLEDFVTRTRITLDQLLLLIRIGALRGTGQNKKALLWEAHQLLGGKKAREEGQPLFQEPAKELRLPTLSHSSLEDAYDELELLGFPVSLSAFEMLQTDFRGEALAADLPERVGQKLRLAGNLVCTKGVRTVRNELMMFGTFLDAEGNFFDTVHFPPSLRQHPFTGLGVYLVLGKVVEEFGFPSVEVEKMAKLPYRKDPRYADCRQADN